MIAKTEAVWRVVVITSSLLYLVGCATITRGSNDVLVINTEPSGASVSTSIGLSCSQTPCALTMPRNSQLVVTIEKKGCKTAQVNVSHRTADAGAAGVAGNILFGGIIGLAVDAGSGATEDLVPNPIDLKLEC